MFSPRHAAPRTQCRVARASKRVGLAMAAAVVVIVMGLPSSAHAAVRSIVAIGNDVGLAGELPLRWAEQDASRLAEVFTSLGGVSSTRATVLLGESPTVLERTLLELKGQIAETKRRGERAEVVLTYSGHGDETHLHLGNAALRIETLIEWVDAVGADATVIVLDACRTGPVRAGKRRGFGEAPAFDVTLVESPALVGRVVLKSASQGEVAQESDDLEGAFFTHHLLAGLRGAADGDNDGAITLNELWAYAHNRTVDQSFGRAAVQHPEVKVELAGQAELILTRTDVAAAQLVLDEALGGSFLVVDERTGRVLFEVQKPTGRALTLAVPPRRLRVQWREGSRFRIADVGARRGDRTGLDASAFTELPRLAGRTRGAEVDPSPWGLTLAVTAALPPTLSGGAIGAYGRAERRLWTTPFSVELNARATYAHATTSLRDYAEVDGLLTAGILGEWWTVVGRLSASASAGAHAIGQRARRLDAARLALANIDLEVERTGMTFGPVALARAGLFVPVVGPFGVEGGVTASARLLEIDRAITFDFDAGMYCGIGVEF